VLGVKTDGTGTSAADAVEQITSELAKCTKDATESCLDVPNKTQECLEQQDEEDEEDSDDEDDDNGNELAEELEKSTKTVTALTAKVETFEADLATRTTELQTSQTTVATLTDSAINNDQTDVLTTVRSELDEVKRQLRVKSSELVEALRKVAISESKSVNSTANNALATQPGTSSPSTASSSRHVPSVMMNVAERSKLSSFKLPSNLEHFSPGGIQSFSDWIFRIEIQMSSYNVPEEEKISALTPYLEKYPFELAKEYLEDPTKRGNFKVFKERIIAHYTRDDEQLTIRIRWLQLKHATSKNFEMYIEDF